MVLVSSPRHGHLYVALDYRECGPNGAPPVAWVDTEGIRVFDLAPSFRAFVEGLRPSDSFASPERPPLAGKATRRRSVFGRRRRRPGGG
jgi:hypothetical protein